MNARPIYTYAIARAFDPGPIERLYGVDGERVHLVGHDDVVAVCSPLAPVWTDEAGRQARLESLDELEALARAHHAVVAGVAAHSVVLPLRLLTIHDGDQGVLRMLRREYGRLRVNLDRLAGRVELGVKVYATVPARAADTAGTAGTGRDYLRRRRADRDRRDDVYRRAATVAGRVETELAALAVDRLRHRPQPSRLSATAGDNVLNAAYLVERERVGEFAGLADRLAADETGIRVEVTGPWAPYSFVDAAPGGSP